MAQLVDPTKYDYLITSENNILRQVKGGSRYEAEWFTPDGWENYPFFESLMLDSSNATPERAKKRLDFKVSRFQQRAEQQNQK